MANDRIPKVVELADESRLMLIHMRECKTFAVFMCVNYGGDHVFSKEDFEVAHFLEHLYASTTSNCEGYDNAKSNDAEVARRGLFMNAYTYPAKTIYEFRGLSTHVEFILQMLLCAYVSFRIDTTVFKAEKEAVLNELASYVADPDNTVNELFNAHIYKDSPYVALNTVRNSMENVPHITEDQLMNTWNTYYRGSPVLFCVAGGFNEHAVRALFRTYVKRAQYSPPRPFQAKFHRGVKEKEYQVEDLHTNVLRVAWFMPFDCFDHLNMTSLRIINYIMTSGMSSRLYLKLRRSEEGSIYSIRGGLHTSHADEVMFMVSTKIKEKKNVRQARDVIVDAFENFVPITDEELTKVKNSYRFHLEEARQSDTPAFWFFEYHDQIRRRKPILPREKIMELVETVSVEDLNQKAQWFRPANRMVFIACDKPKPPSSHHHSA